MKTYEVTYSIYQNGVGFATRCVYSNSEEEAINRVVNDIITEREAYGCICEYNGSVLIICNGDGTLAERYTGFQAKAVGGEVGGSDLDSMKNYSVTTTENLWRLCNKHKWFTCGSNTQYEKLFYANKNGCPIEEIATIIWLCSSDDWCRRDILSVLTEERKKFEEERMKRT